MGHVLGDRHADTLKTVFLFAVVEGDERPAQRLLRIMDNLRLVERLLLEFTRGGILAL
jgi:hypothetical protein